MKYDHLQGDRFRHAAIFLRWRPDKPPGGLPLRPARGHSARRARRDLPDGRTSRAAPTDRSRDRAAPAPAGAPRARARGSRARASRSTSARASRRPARRRAARCAAASRMARLPALEPGERVVLLRGAADLDERLRRAHAGRCGFGRSSRRDGCDARRLAGLLRVVRRPGRIAEPFRLLPRRQLEQRVERAGHARRSPRAGRRSSAKRAGIVRSVKSSGAHVEELVPRDGRGDARVGLRAHRVRAGDGAVLGVLVVVEEDAVALLLPPLAGGERRARAARPRARARARRAAPR